jgi:hypothetical protein
VSGDRGLSRQEILDTTTTPAPPPHRRPTITHLRPTTDQLSNKSSINHNRPSSTTNFSHFTPSHYASKSISHQLKRLHPQPKADLKQPAHSDPAFPNEAYNKNIPQAGRASTFVLCLSAETRRARSISGSSLVLTCGHTHLPVDKTKAYHSSLLLVGTALSRKGWVRWLLQTRRRSVTTDPFSVRWVSYKC